MSLKGQYVRDKNGQTGMIESEEPDPDGLVSVYYGTLDRMPVRGARAINDLEPIDPPKNHRIDGEVPRADLEAPPDLTPKAVSNGG
jgi:hypothetical protein